MVTRELLFGFALLLTPFLSGLRLEAQEPPPQEPGPSPGDEEDLTKLSLEELLKVRITTVGKREQPLLDAPSAIFVIRPDDIRRTGATSIAEALRMVPGMDVARLDANKWAVSARGFNGRFANKLLVLIDGRTVYTPLFSGVFWEVQDTVLEDIDRIEVIRGPGATMWGSNAVNGVVNIITRSPRDTQGTLVSAGGGTEERVFGLARYGDRSGDLYYRAYAKGRDHDQSMDVHDSWWTAQGGFRTEWQAGPKDVLTFQGDYYGGELGEPTVVPTFAPPFSAVIDERTQVSGGNACLRWTRKIDEKTGLSMQLYYDSMTRDSAILEEWRSTGDFDFQHRFPLMESHDLVWGGGIRMTADWLENSQTVIFDPDHRTLLLAGVFFQDEVTLVPERLKWSLGSKFEYYTYTHLAIQPTMRAIWTPDAGIALWAAVSRAVRTPSQGERDARLNTQVVPGTPPVEVALVKSNFGSENLWAFELGSRVQPRDWLTFDVATFFNLYDSLRTFEPGTPFPEATPVPHVVQPLLIDNNMRGRSLGVEASIRARPIEPWLLQLSYSFLYLNLIPEEGSLDTTSESAEHESPRNQVHLRSSWDLPHGFQFDLIPRYVGPLSALDIPAYIELDARLGWRVSPQIEAAVVGQNLLHRSHQEFAPQLTQSLPAEVERGVYFSLTARF